jgi:NAD(P)-dependent dehydrogenase (short-subunit alcohol dehydrogenase family)
MPVTAVARPSVVVTGASTGIGRATALRLAGNGYHVFAGVRQAVHGEALRQAGGDITPLIMDVTDVASVAQAAELAGRTIGEKGLAGLVNNAGIGVTGPVEAIPLQDLRRLYEVNVFGQVAVIQHFLPLLRLGQGRMINIGSIGDRLTIPFGSPLTSSKWAIASITEALRIELRPWGIHVVLIEPASIDTETVNKTETDAERTLSAMCEANKSLYAQAYRSMTLRGMARVRHGSPPNVVAHVIHHALTVKRPRTRYLVGKDARLLATVARWAPDRLFDRMRVKLFDLPKTFGEAQPAMQRH